MEMGVFTPKLNFVDGKIYSIEEQVVMPESGVYEASLVTLKVTAATGLQIPKLALSWISQSAI